MKKAITISIPEPCHEDWGKMSSTEKGKFCKVCTKEVFDFTKATDEELIKKLDAGKNLCGKFKTSQLDREVKLERKTGNGLLPYAASLLVPMGLFGASEGFAQGGPVLSEDEYMSLQIESKPLKSIITITGFVTDAHNVPLNNAEVFVLETGQSVRTAPDGSYKLVCTSGSTIYSIKDGVTTQHTLLGTKDEQVDMMIEPETKTVTAVVGLIRTTPVIDEQETPQTPKIDTDEEIIEGEIDVQTKAEATQNNLEALLEGKVGGIVIINSSVKETDTTEEEKTRITISGTVKDEQKIPLPGVNVIVKGAQTATQTDFDGNYQLTVKPGSTLVYSYLGYETKAISASNISNEISLNLILQEEWLGEVVIIRKGLFGRIIDGFRTNRHTRIAKRQKRSAERKGSRILKKATRHNSKRKTEKPKNSNLCRLGTIQKK